MTDDAMVAVATLRSVRLVGVDLLGWADRARRVAGEARECGDEGAATAAEAEAFALRVAGHVLLRTVTSGLTGGPVPAGLADSGAGDAIDGLAARFGLVGAEEGS